jgi:hypothetical protein
MAGVGPAPKDPAKRARRNAQPAQTVLPFTECDQPELPEGFPWPDATQQWWEMWRTAPQATLFGVTDWNFLLDTALIHADVWGNWNLDRMPELRIRVAKFGATPEDRARLRITFAEADEKDAKRPQTPPTSAEERYGTLRALPTAKRDLPAASSE